eukprot:scpid94220/ scgid35429/ Small glutamine-rich tetratricopeptide repeat-containing protein alpha; Alpha-SGT
MEVGDNRRRLIFSLMRLLEDDCNKCTSDVRESLEVAMQCIGEVYGVQSQDQHQASRLGVQFDLQTVFDKAAEKECTLTEEQKAEAQLLKEKGNDLLRKGEFQQAVDMYSKAIAVDRNNAIYFSNRAAAYAKLQQHDRVVEDCQEAIRIDPAYSKAHSRLGNALNMLGRKAEAVESFKKAVELDPSNQAYKDTLDTVNAEMQSQQSAAPAGAGGMPAGMPDLNGVDFSAMLNNPGFMSMAANLVNTPGFANMASSMMGAGAGA